MWPWCLLTLLPSLLIWARLWFLSSKAGVEPADKRVPCSPVALYGIASVLKGAIQFIWTTISWERREIEVERRWNLSSQGMTRDVKKGLGETVFCWHPTSPQTGCVLQCWVILLRCIWSFFPGTTGCLMETNVWLWFFLPYFTGHVCIQKVLDSTTCPDIYFCIFSFNCMLICYGLV